MATQNIIAAFLLGALSTFALGLCLIKVPALSRWVSRLDFRRKTGRAIPQLGGLALFVPLSFYAIATNGSPLRAVLIAAIPLMIVGVLDDIRELSAMPKLMAQIIAVGIWLMQITPGELVLAQAGVPESAAIALTAFWMVGMINATNMIDGMDGVAGTFALITAIIVSLVTRGNAVTPDMMMLSGTCIGFLFLNRHPARLYLGDVGSTLLGLLLSAFAASIPVQPRFSSVLIPLFIMGYPAIDAALAIARRALARSSLMSGDHDHIHHKLQKIGLSVPQSLAFIAAGTLTNGLAAVAIAHTQNFAIQLTVALVAVLGLGALLTMLYYAEYRLAHQISSYSRTIISEHLPIGDRLEVPEENFRATVYDLLPYYKELQQSGILTVQSFIRDLSESLLESHDPSSQYASAGSYTIIVLEPVRNPHTKNELTVNFQNILKKHGVLKNLSKPWGLTFYTGDAGRDLFLKKFSSLQKKDNSVSSQRAA